MSWTILQKQELLSVLQAVRTQDEDVLFDPAFCEAMTFPLPFYTRFKLLRLTNYASMPIFTFHYLTDGVHYFYLDGHFTPMQAVHEIGDFHLDRTSVMAYLNFYFFAVTQDDGEIFVVKDPNAYPYQDVLSFEPDPVFKFSLTPKPDITIEEDGGYMVTTPLFVDGTLVRAVLRIDDSGRVIFVSQKMMMGDGPALYNTSPPTR